MNKEEIKKKLEGLGDTNPKETLRIRGELIKLLKEEIAKTKDESVKSALRLELSEELEKHKVIIKKMRTGKNYSLPKRVGLKVKEIATTISLFMNKSDIINKAKNVITNTTFTSVIVGSLAIGLNALTGGTISLAMLAGLAPTFAYIGLANILKQAMTDTPYESLEKMVNDSDELSNIKDFNNKCIMNNQPFLELLANKSKEKNKDNLITINEQLIEMYQAIIKEAPNDKIRQSLTLELASNMQDLKKCYEKKIHNYKRNKESMNAVDFAKLEKKYLGLCANLTKIESFFPDALKFNLKNLGISTATMYVARIFLSSFFPSIAFDGIKDIITPFIITVINNTASKESFKKHLNVVNSKYTDTLMRINNPEVLKELASTNEKSLA